jgi:hypothetical protein
MSEKSKPMCFYFLYHVPQALACAAELARVPCDPAIGSSTNDWPAQLPLAAKRSRFASV